MNIYLWNKSKYPCDDCKEILKENITKLIYLDTFIMSDISEYGVEILQAPFG